ncbi:hypothetical protein LMG26857_03469 [Achromobacter anxifer]|uniref:hypothetical protein n=1 Tax=Achromobacter anxifer TaxID=1287737 RepID=UPI00155C2EA9|nr:hypothetical protein [Achromobacter anxifer]CAB5514410.1 hypothetical protein LMG26857_03469 [Achromobacter anxifer]
MHSETTWTCRDGRVLAIVDMTTQHLQNTVRMLRRKGFVTPDEMLYAAHIPSSMGDYAQLAAEQAIADMKVIGSLEPMEAELARRGVTSVAH